MDSRQVRVRIAPSPTGDPHVGLGYITLFNYVFAKKNGGKLILRIEDTDRTRFRASSEQQIMESLKWLGLAWDEGPDIGGSYGPYRQSERKEIHLKHADTLVQGGHAYKCFCTEERLTAMREQQKKEGQTTKYDGRCRDLTPADVRASEDRGDMYVIRLKMPKTGKSIFRDRLRGDVEFDFDRMDDQVLIKSDGFPTYHLANVVDDHLMGITHVIRAEEWVSSTPKHVVLYRSFGWDLPEFIHMPLLRNPDRSKISKRKNPTSLVYYRRKGILPQAMLNFLALMGWAFSETEEIFTLQQMMDKFDFKQVHLGGPVFDLQKLLWLNGQYVRKLNPDQFADYLQTEVFNREYIKQIHPLAIERMEAFEQFVDKFSFFFNGAIAFTNDYGKTNGELKKMFSALVEELDELYTWDTASIDGLLKNQVKMLGWKPKEFFMPLRMAVTGRADSPPLVETMQVLGREIVRFRLREAMDAMSS